MKQTQIQFIGATGTVTGSKYLLTVDKKNYLVNCGLFIGNPPAMRRLPIGGGR